MDYAVIMAGGSGRRLWPLSRQDRPKQLLRLLGKKSLLRTCFERLLPVIPAERIMVLTNKQYRHQVHQELPELAPDMIVGEPQIRDTCGAIALAATILDPHDPDATMAVVTADHAIRPEQAFQQVLKDGMEFINLNPDQLLVFGVTPTFPSTQLGYIKLGPDTSTSPSGRTFHKVETFKEKPDPDTAATYLASGQYLWNSGMFVWKARVILDLICRFIPQSSGPLGAIRSALGSERFHLVLEEQFPRLPRISIDYAVMEKAQQIYAIKLDCQWLDLGSYQALAELIGKDSLGNAVSAGITVLLDCKGSVIISQVPNHLIACIGLQDVVVVHCEDATLVCPLDQAHRLKELLDHLEARGASNYL
ncbi:MAG: sugar phosphate nucleotidyltransferase [Sedimentisphaerales bacterium]|nr:sugar phosphate nucleotidyltransferase [Sedimentisphaerales bacterium]